MPTVPDDIKNQFKEISNTKLPHFFKYAKDKEEHQVQELPDNIEDCKVVDKLEYIIPNKPLRFKKLFGDVDYKMLMWNAYTVHDEKVIERFIELDKKKQSNIDKDLDSVDYNHNNFVKEEMNELGLDIKKIVDILVRKFYKSDSSYKKSLWNVYGYHIYRNLDKNMSKYRRCEKCNVLFEKKSNNDILCKKCYKENEKELRKERNKRYYEKLRRS